MNVTKDLMDEHQLILGYIRLLKEYTDLANRDASGVLLEKGAQFVDFIQNFADRFHHAKEEDVLFKHMEAGGALTHCNPLPQMLYEHEEGRAAVKTMLGALDKGDEAVFSRAALAYAGLLEDHIDKEDNILYQMAENGLTDPQKSIILNEYEAAEEAGQGTAVWATYTAQFKELEAYLNTCKPAIAR